MLRGMVGRVQAFELPLAPRYFEIKSDAMHFDPSQ